MFYEPKKGYPFSHNPFDALVFPRPIGWISSLSEKGIANLAPYSFFNAIAYEPPQVMFAVTGNHDQGGSKDSLANILSTKEFVVNLATKKLKNQVSKVEMLQNELVILRHENKVLKDALNIENSLFYKYKTAKSQI